MSIKTQRRSSKEQFWRTMMRQWRRSGLSIRAFCADRDLAEPTFYAWRRTIAQRDAGAAHFIPVHIVGNQEPSANSRGSGLELVLGAGRVLRIGPGFDEPTLRRVLALFEESQP